MGRKTWLSLGKALPLRRNIVLSHRHDFLAEEAEIVHSVEDIVSLAASEQLFIIGGAELFRLFLPLADYLYLTHIDADFEGDTLFPPFELHNWQKSHESTLYSVSGYKLNFTILKRLH